MKDTDARKAGIYLIKPFKLRELKGPENLTMIENTISTNNKKNAG